MGVFIQTYTDASTTEVGLLYMLMPLSALIFRPIICSMADREQAHQRYLMICLFITAISYLPFVIIPLLGPAIYVTYSRFCWYFLVTLKVIGDVAFGGVVSIGDSLAINYAERIGTDFSVFRVWGTISWMFFGFIIGQINEVWFLPKYVPGFLVLVSSSLLDMFIIWLWPKEYFIMSTSTNKQVKTDQQLTVDDKKMKKGSAMTKCLLPKEVVWAHAKKKLKSLVTCSCFSAGLDEPVELMPPSAISIERIPGSIDSIDDKSIDSKKGALNDNRRNVKQHSKIEKKVQMQILFLLIRRDARIIPYLIMFICAGATIVPVSFFFMSLAERCHENDSCNFSQLGGFLQVSMAIAETILFIYIKRITETIGRLNTIAIAFLLTAVKYTFYGSPLWPQVDPYFSLVSELPHGIIFGTFLTSMVELGHLFATEVEFIVPELVDKGIIDKADSEVLKLSLAATMQALISSFNDGFGRGLAALAFGLIVDHYSYRTLWLTVGIGAAIVFIIIEVINILDYIFKFKLGIDVQMEKSRLVIVENGTNPVPEQHTRDVDQEQCV